MLQKIKRNPDAILAIAIAIVLPIIFEGDSKIWVAVSFGVFILAFGRKIWVAIAGKLDERAANIETEIEDAQRLREEAQTLLADYEAKRKKAEVEADQIIMHAQKEAERDAESARLALEETLKRRSELAVQRIKHAEDEALSAVRQEAATLAIRAASNIIRKNMNDDRANILIEKSIEEARSKLH